MRIFLIDEFGTFLTCGGWKKKSHAEYWIQERISVLGLDWRVGGRIKFIGEDRWFEVVDKNKNSINWLNVKAEKYNYSNGV